MNIQLQNTNYFPHLGGVQWIMAHMARELLRRGHGVSVLCKADDGMPTRSEWEGAQVRRHPAMELSGRGWVFEPWHDVRTVTDYLRSDGHGQEMLWPIHETYAVASARALPQRPMMYIVQHNTSRMIGLNWQFTSWSSRLAKKAVQWQWAQIQREALHAAPVVVTWAQITKDDMVRCFGVDPRKVHVVLPGPGTWHPTNEQAATSLRATLAIPEKAAVVLSSARLVPNKNVAMLVRAMAHLKDREAVLVILGGGPEQLSLECLAKELGVRARVRFAGRQHEVAAYYELADVFVFPSVFEGFGIVLLEAMAMGKPCIGLKADYPHVVTATEEVIEEGQTGFCVDPYSIQELADRIDVLIADDTLRQRMGEHGRQRCHDVFRWDRHVDQLLELAKN